MRFIFSWMLLLMAAASYAGTQDTFNDSNAYVSMSSEMKPDITASNSPINLVEFESDTDHQLDVLDEDLIEEGLGEKVQMTCQCLGSLLPATDLTFHGKTPFVYLNRYVKSLLRPPII